MLNLKEVNAYPRYFQYTAQSQHVNFSALCHAKKYQQSGCFFDGQARQPTLFAKALVALSQIIRADFSPKPKPVYDPIVTVEQENLRFEGFSSCNSMYIRLDVGKNALMGHFFAQGSTHVNFNDPILTALSTLKKEQNLHFRISHDAVHMQVNDTYFTEQKVKLSPRWVKALTEVTYELAQLDEKMHLNSVQSRQFWQILPKKSESKTLYLQQKFQHCQLSPIAHKEGVALQALERLQLLQVLAPYIDQIKIYQKSQHGSCALVFSLPNMQLTCLLSPSVTRGFSGEGQYLDDLLHDLPLDWVAQALQHVQKNALIKQPTFQTESAMSERQKQQLKTTLSAMGVVGFDLDQQDYFYRDLPMHLQHILSLNPRLKHAQQLLDQQKISSLIQQGQRIEAHVQGSEDRHTVLIQASQAQCTCEWFQRHQHHRGFCQHILAVKVASREQVPNAAHSTQDHSVIRLH